MDTLCILGMTRTQRPISLWMGIKQTSKGSYGRPGERSKDTHQGSPYLYAQIASLS